MKLPKPPKYKPSDTLKSGSGYDMRVKDIHPDILSEHSTVEYCMAVAEFLQAELKEGKKLILTAITAHLEKTAAKYGEKWQGNATLHNFDKTKKVEFNNSKVMKFDSRLNIAKSKIDRCLLRWAEGSHEELKQIVQSAFDVDKQGNVCVTQIIRLKQFQFKDEEWNEAIDIINESLMVDYTRRYINFKKRRDNTIDSWEAVLLTFASLNVD